jgi:uncharacterized protein (DUF952 family)
MASPELIYKIADASAYAEALDDGLFAGAPIDLEDGFIHFSTAAQLGETLKLHFKGRTDLVILAVRTAGLGDALKWEPSRGGQLFPHLYGALELVHVAWSEPVSVAADGSTTLPSRVQ